MIVPILPSVRGHVVGPLQRSVPQLHGPSDYTVSPDGRRFVINTVTGPPVIPPIQVAVNWTAPSRP